MRSPLNGVSTFTKSEQFKTRHENKRVDVFSGVEQRRRRTPQEKITIMQQSIEPRMTISYVFRLHGVNANQVFKWRKPYQEPSLTAITAGEDVVPASELTAAIEQSRELQCLLGKTTVENEISERSRGVWPGKNI